MNWRKIKAEYIAGGISQRALAEKYGISRGHLMNKARKEGWFARRCELEAKTIAEAEQKATEEVVDNAILLERVKNGLLRRLVRMVEAYPDTNAAEVKKKENGAILTYRMKDIAATYAALEDKTIKASVDIEDLTPLTELLRDE